ncbi:MAG TPA: response regulator transcription factor [Chloroflexota bacterium]|nr:response regulator transcription factor [Chloroflexota bacterium]
MEAPRPVVLVVEDDAGLAELIHMLLEGAGYAVERAADGTTGLVRLLAGGVDLVLLDLMLPGLDGLEVCRRARAQRQDAFLPIIMMTALDSEQQRVDGFAVGADDYVPKPFSTDELLARVEVWLRTRRRVQTAHAQLVKQQAELREAERRLLVAQLEGVTVTARELAHRLNNHLQGIIGALDVLTDHPGLTGEGYELTREALQQARDSARVIAQLQRVVRVETRETPVGPALDLDRSTDDPGL